MLHSVENTNQRKTGRNQGKNRSESGQSGMFLEREAPEKLGNGAAGKKIECESDVKNCRSLADEIIKERSGVTCGVSGSRA